MGTIIWIIVVMAGLFLIYATWCILKAGSDADDLAEKQWNERESKKEE